MIARLHQQERGRLVRVIARIGCLYTGHDDHRVCDPYTRTFKLRCAQCERETTGWTIDAAEPVVSKHVEVAQRKGRMWWVKAVIERRGA